MRIRKKRCFVLSALCLILLILYIYYIKSKNSARESAQETLLYDVFAGLTSLLDFLQSDYADLNIDGLLGIRMCQGSLLGATEVCILQSLECSDDLRNTLLLIYEKLDEVAKKAMPHIEAKSKEYYDKYQAVMKRPIMIKYIPETWSELPQEIVDNKLTYDALKGDRCFAGMIGTHTTKDGRSFPPCTLFEGCWKMMTQKGTVGYYTTHQLLYLILGQHSGCERKLDFVFKKSMGVSLRSWQRYLCEQIYIDAAKREHNNAVELKAEDLFLEQSAVCGNLGFENFFKEAWIRMALSWQHFSGCFTLPISVVDLMITISHKRREIDQVEAELSGDKALETRGRKFKDRIFPLEQERAAYVIELNQMMAKLNQAKGVPLGRRLMEEVVMGGDCLSHKTGVGAAALGAYVRYLVARVYAKASDS